MATYRLNEAVKGEFYVPVIGAITFEFEAGVIEPADAETEAKLKHLVGAGVATENTPEPNKSRRRESAAAASTEASTVETQEA